MSKARNLKENKEWEGLEEGMEKGNVGMIKKIQNGFQKLK